MKIAFIVSRIDKPSTRFRVLPYITYLKNKNIESKVLIYPKTFFKRLKFIISLKKFDYVIIQRILLNNLEILLLKRKIKKLIFDFDDAIMLNDTNKKKSISILKNFRFYNIIKKVNHVISGNEYLNSYVKKFNPNQSIIPTPIDTNIFIPKISNFQTINKLTIGWIGSKSTLIYLDLIKSILDNLHLKYPYISFKIIADKFTDFKKIPIIKKTWKKEDEITDLQSIDIGVMPLFDDKWSKGKCGFKLIQYMSASIPSVASPVGVNKKIIDDGINGFLAKDEKEWFIKLEKLILDKNLRESIGKKAREKVIKDYSVETNAPILIDVIKRIND